MTVHPHVRGERPTTTCCTRCECGSSPRAWGTHRRRHRKEAGDRFIPTCVGNAGCCRSACRSVSVHPHVRGERGSGPSCSELVVGSSPRAWGTRSRRCIAARCESVHPHVRGERVLCVFGICSAFGSSPRAWGTRPRVHSWIAYRRFIPTCVGNARHQPKRFGGFPVHPHVRGERVPIKIT